MSSTGSSTNTVKDDVAIEVVDLWKSYQGTYILKGCSLRVPKGKTLIILGKSGVGKSVLLRQILGIEQPDRGHIFIHGVCVTNLKDRERFLLKNRMGMLFQSSALFDSMNVFENVAFYLRQHGDPDADHPLSEETIRVRVLDALEKVYLRGFEKKMPSELSGGQKRRVALARLMVYKPQILLYDEPTTGLDPITTMQINELIVKISSELKATSIIVTHDIQSALMIGDLFSLHDDGKIVCVEEKSKFLQSDNPLVQSFLEHAFIEGHPEILTRDGIHA
jgi:phospholipid/cholesterol/gamma-HCH transport system ATP-binding protein